VQSTARRTGVPGRGRSAGAGRPSLLVACLVLLVGFAWAFASPAAFAAPAEAGVALFDDDGGTAMFTAADRLAPGRPEAACVRVGADSARAGDVVTFAATGVSGALADHLTVTLAAGDGGRFGDCSGFTGSTLWTGTLRGLGAASAGGGIPTGWQPERDPVRSFRVTVVVDPALSQQGLTAHADLSWRLVRDAVEPPPPSPAPEPTDRPTDGPTDGPTLTPPVAPTDRATSAPTHPPTGPRTTTAVTTSATAAVAPSGDDDEPDLRIGGRLRAIQEVARRAATAVVAVVTAPQYPLMAIAVAVLFLAVQDLIDRRDPKLAGAVTRRESEELFPDVLVPGGGSWRG